MYALLLLSSRTCAHLDLALPQAQKAADEASRRVASSGGKGLPRLNEQLSRPNSRRGQGRDQFGVAAAGADGWSAPVPQRPAKAGDLSAFGKIRESSSAISLGPSGAFAARANKAKEAARPTTPNNPFALLSGGSDAAAEASTSQRTKLVLAPRTKPLEGEEKPEEGEAAAEEEEEEDDGAIDPNAVSMSRSEGERRAGNSVKEVRFRCSDRARARFSFGTILMMSLFSLAVLLSQEHRRRNRFCRGTSS
jgi:translation initiation factor 4G